MNRIDGIEFIASETALSDAVGQESLPEPLLAPFQALIKHILEASASKPFVIYLLSSEAVRGVRDYFAHALARTLSPQVPSASVVDCDFTAVGMSGVVPQKDALGFLDYLLYGSSLGVVTQEASQGVRIIGAGSFPVSKKMPVSMDSFADAARRLAAQCRIVIFCGPARDNDENIHPISEAADLLIHVSYEKRFPVGRADPFEEELVKKSKTPLISVRITSPAEVMESAPEPAAEIIAERPPRMEEVAEPIIPRPEPAIGGGEWKAEWREEEAPRKSAFFGLPFEKRHSGSIWAKIIPAVIAFGLIGFLFWWFILTKPMQGTGEEPRLAAVDTTETTEGPPAAGQPTTKEMDDEGEAGSEASMQGRSVASDSLIQADNAGTGEDRIAEVDRSDATDEKGTSEPPGEEAAQRTDQVQPVKSAAVSPEDVYIAKDFTEFAGKYLVHISSFREIERAKEDAAYLLRNNFAACVIPVDISSKGRWYRVYVGPVETRDEALQQKIMLDELPSVKFTRITRSPGS